MAAVATKTDPLIVVILGCTGTGKSKLSIEIGKIIEGEVISADSMQVYRGLDIITNKVTEEERAIVPHHTLDFVEPSERYSVVEFKNAALSKISDIISRRKVPIIVGGTNYYIESLLWENLIDEKRRKRNDFGNGVCVPSGNTEHEDLNQSYHSFASDESSTVKEPAPDRFDGQNSGNDNVEGEDKDKERKLDDQCGMKNDCGEQRHFGKEISSTRSEISKAQTSLHEQLAEVDAAMAQKLHPNDVRKIKRSLQIYQQSGLPHSDHIALQHSQHGSSDYSGPLRFKNVCVLWLQCDVATLDKRLDARVDQMIEQGLVKELLEFQNSSRGGPLSRKLDTVDGIFQSIGFKEFREFLDLNDPTVENNLAVFDKCVDAMKCATRRYARKQIRWITNRFLGRPATSSPDVYGLDATNLEQWECVVLEKALEIVKSFVNGAPVSYFPLERVNSHPSSKHSNHTCTVCNGRTIIGEKNWTAHLRSRSHRHYKKKAKISEENI